MNKSKKLCAIGFFALLLVAPGIAVASGTEKHPAPTPHVGSGTKKSVEAKSRSENEERGLGAESELRQEVTIHGADTEDHNGSGTERIPEKHSKGSGTERQ